MPDGFAGVQQGDDRPRLVPVVPYVPSPGRRLLAGVGSLLRPFELSARILMAGLLGFLLMAALAFTAIFTAGVVNRLMGRRLVALSGPRSLLRRDHVVVVGLGQVGLRLCLLLRELKVPVLAVESNPEADYVARAKQYGVPVVVGQGGSRFLLRRLYFRGAFLHEKVVYLIGRDGRIEPFDADLELTRQVTAPRDGLTQT